MAGSRTKASRGSGLCGAPGGRQLCLASSPPASWQQSCATLRRHRHSHHGKATPTCCVLLTKDRMLCKLFASSW